MKKNTKNLLEAIDQLMPQRDKHSLVEMRADNVINGVINLLRLIRESYDDEQALELTRRLVLSIKNEDADKFMRKLREYKKHDGKPL
jgi:hypothetical protein